MAKTIGLPAGAVKAAMPSKRGAMRCWLHKHKAEVIRLFAMGASVAGVVRSYNSMSRESPISDASGRATVEAFLKSHAASIGTSGSGGSTEAVRRILARTHRSSDKGDRVVVPAVDEVAADSVDRMKIAAESAVDEMAADSVDRKRFRRFRSTEETDRAIMLGDIGSL